MSNGNGTIVAQDFSFNDLVENKVSQKEALELLTDGAINLPTAQRYIEYLVAQARKASGGAPRMKVSDKGGVTFRGVVGTNAKFGVTLYPVTLQWLFANREQIEAFLEQHRDQLSWEKPKS